MKPSKGFLRRAWTGCTFLFAFTSGVLAQGNYPITMQVQLVPPYSAYASDYLDQALISFTNFGQVPLDIYLRGRFENDRGQFIETSPNHYSLVPIHVPGMQTVVVQGLQLDDGFLDLNHLNTNLTDEDYNNFKRLGMLPEGYYSFCIYAYKRNVDGTYIPVSDPQGPGACFSLNIGYVTPPVILAPADADSITPSPMQNVNVSWTVPQGDLAGALVAYDLYLVKVMPGYDPNVAMNNAVQYSAGLFLKQPDIVLTNFQFTNLSGFNLEEGSQYALMVQAKDLNHHTAFENNGMSAVVAFTYGNTPDGGPGGDMGGGVGTPVVVQGSCSCVADVGALDQSNNNGSISPGGSFTMATVTVHVGSLNNNGSTLSGDGTIQINNVPVQVTFQDVVVNADGVAIAGTATGKTANGFGFLNNGGTPSVSTADYNSFTQRLANYNLDAVADGAGLMLPFGLHSLGAPDAVNAGVVALSVTPVQAAYNAVAVVQLADANNVLSLAAMGVCFSDASAMCGDALFTLAQDFAVPGLPLTFKSYASASEPGTYVRYSANALQQFHIHADYAFPASLITKTDGTQAIGVLDADAASWSDWTASVSLDPFHAPILTGVDFTLIGAALYDHSTLQNPAGMPTSLGAGLTEKDAEIGTPAWTGFLIPSVGVALPGIVSSSASPDGRLTIGASNLVLDQYGLSGLVGAQNVVNIGDGSLGGWYCSVDHIGITLLNSSFTGGGMGGQLILPFSDHNNAQSRIGYTCTLTSSPDGGGLTYQFSAIQQNDVDFSAWWAHINLNNCAILVTNNTADGHTRASADLSGKLSLEHEIDNYSLSLDLMSLEHLVVATDEPYVQLGSFTAGLSSPQHFMAGFPISLGQVEPVFTGSSAGLSFTMGLSLSDLSNNILPNATTSLSITANVLGGERPAWQGVCINVNQICVDGDLAGYITINHSCIDFFRNDPVFGDGIKGNLFATFKGLDIGSVECDVKFGNKAFNYWYFDASVTISTPIQIALGIAINGFGGGAWYNMVRTANKNMDAKDYFQNMNAYELGAYRPEINTLGFKAKVGVCSNDGLIYGGFGELSMTFNTGQFSVNSIDGRVYVQMLKAGTDVAGDGSAPLQGTVDLHMGIADEVYSITGAVEMKFPIGTPFVTGNGSFTLLADAGNQEYYIKVGDPDHRVSVSLVNVFNMNAYFMAGNQIDGIPPPDPQVFDVGQLVGYHPLAYDPSDGGLVFGAGLSISESLQFACFYAQVDFAAGFDVSLAHYKQGCNGSPDLPGLNGWYAIGQVYAKLSGSLGMDVDVPMLGEAKVSAGEVGASVLLQGGLPNPYWFDGYANIYFRALGFFEDNISFHVSIGDKCVPEKQVFTMPLIAELKPTDQSTNVPLNANPEAVFNYPVEKPFEIVVQDENGTPAPRQFRLDLDNFKVTNLENNSVAANYFDDNSHALFIDDQNKDLALDPDAAWKGQTRYSFDVTVKAMELVGGVPQQCTYGGDPVEESSSVTFKTGACKLDELIATPGSRLGAFPFPGQRYFLQGESPRGAIILDKAYECAATPNEHYDLLVRFTPVKDGQAQPATEEPVVLNGSNYLTFNIPPLPNETIIRVEVIKRNKLNSSDNYALVNTSYAMTSMHQQAALNPNSHLSIYAQNSAYGGGQWSVMAGTPSLVQHGNQVTLSNANINQALRLTDKNVDIVLYSYHFRTSRYNTLAEKVAPMFYSTTGTWSILGSPQVDMKTAEHFDDFDANGFVSGGYIGGKVYFSVPLVAFSESMQGNAWVDNYALPCVYMKFTDAGLSVDNERTRNGLAMWDVQHLGIACEGTPYCVPKRPITLDSYDPPLSMNEIMAAEPWTMPVYRTGVVMTYPVH